MWNEGQGQPVSAKQYASYDPGLGPDNAEEAAGCCSRTFFVWVYALVSLGNEKQLDESDGKCWLATTARVLMSHATASFSHA